MAERKRVIKPHIRFMLRLNGVQGQLLVAQANVIIAEKEGRVQDVELHRKEVDAYQVRVDQLLRIAEKNNVIVALNEKSRYILVSEPSENFSEDVLITNESVQQFLEQFLGRKIQEREKLREKIEELSHTLQTSADVSIDEMEQSLADLRKLQAAFTSLNHDTELIECIKTNIEQIIENKQKSQ